MHVARTSSEQMDSGDHVSLDIDKLGESMKGKLKILRPLSDKCYIYRVPKRLRELNAKAYTPRVISIGPLHHRKEELKEMEQHKKMYLREFLELSEVSVEGFIAAIVERETRLCDSYAETFENLSQMEFVEMMLLDCSFVIMFLLKLCSPVIQSRRIDRIFNKPWICNEMRFDLCLLENQLPFFILEDLLNLSKIRHGQEEYSLMKLTRAFLCAEWGIWVQNNILGQINSSEVHHFVNFVRICQQTQPNEVVALTRRSVAELHRAGIKFKLGSSRNLLDIRFDGDKGMLEIPRLVTVDQTEILFRNLQAYAQM